MNRLFRLGALLTVAASALLAGCATRLPMALSEGKAPKEDKVTVLMHVSLANNYKTRYQPKLIVAHFEVPNADSKEQRFNFQPDEAATQIPPETDDEKVMPHQYFLSMELDPGEYLFGGMSSMAQAFPFIGHFHTPIMQTLSFKSPGVFYIGHVNAAVRERKDDEPRAGGVIPVLDQAVTGASGGAFDVEVSDDWDTVRNKFVMVYPSLEKAEVQKQILPAWDRKQAYPE
ncbi:hypothetical protein [Hydrogenophaga sp. 5NK40-0174]|uniref:hypothetical protein n=1 Tax=Hydrogenophaga sp. 5NK40-0174 TaxID=3127649 RepID=UPI003108CA86